MKCKSCGAVLKDDSLYFCTGCGAMLKNPVTGEFVSENREDFAAEEDIIPVKEVTEISENEDSPEAALINEKPADENTEKTTEEPHGELLIEKEIEKIPLTTEMQEPQNDFINSGIPQENNEPQQKTPVKVGGGRLFGASVIAIFSGILLAVVCTLFSLKLGVSADSLHNSIKKMNIWAVLTAELDGKTVSDNIYYGTDFEKASHGFADETEFAMYLSKTDFLEFSAQKVWEYASYILHNKDISPTVSENEFTEFFMKNGDTAKETFGYEMQIADYNSIRSALAENETAEKFSIDRIGWELRFRLENIRYILSYLTLGIFTALFIVLLIWIAIVVNKKSRYLLGFYGNIFFWSGLAVVLLGISASAGSAVGYIITGEFMCYLCVSLFLPAAVYALCMGAIMTLAGYILKKVKKSVKIKEKRNEAVEKALNEALQN